MDTQGISVADLMQLALIGMGYHMIGRTIAVTAVL